MSIVHRSGQDKGIVGWVENGQCSLPGIDSGVDHAFNLRVMEFFNDVGGDPLKPSLFELVAQEQLRDLLQPALKYVLSVRE